MLARVQVVAEVKASDVGLSGFPTSDGWDLCFQQCRYVYNDGSIEEGYRFIWRDPNGKLRPQRGQARIPSLDVVCKLVEGIREKLPQERDKRK